MERTHQSTPHKSYWELLIPNLHLHKLLRHNHQEDENDNEPTRDEYRELDPGTTTTDHHRGPFSQTPETVQNTAPEESKTWNEPTRARHTDPKGSY